MHEPLFSACLRGAGYVIGLARMAVEAAEYRRGKDAPIAYPDTAYELPVVFGLTDIRVSTIADAGKVLELAETLVRSGATLENRRHRSAPARGCRGALGVRHRYLRELFGFCERGWRNFRTHSGRGPECWRCSRRRSALWFWFLGLASTRGDRAKEAEWGADQKLSACVHGVLIVTIRSRGSRASPLRAGSASIRHLRSIP